jgi:hypothetical protein
MSTSSLHSEPTGSTPTYPLTSRAAIWSTSISLTSRDDIQAPSINVGYSDDIDRRIETHRKGHGSPLLAAALAVGIDFRVVRTWPGTDRHFERKLHNRHGSRICPEPECVSERRRRQLQLRLRLEG